MSTDRNSTEVEKTHQVNAVPAFLQRFQAEDRSLESLRGYRVLNRLVILQPLSKLATPSAENGGKPKFSPGAALLMPVQIGVAGPGESFDAVPLFQFTDYVQWRDRQDNSGKKIVARTTDPQSEIAVNSRSEKLRLQEYPGSANPDKPFKYAFVENINFVMMLRNMKDSSLEAQMAVVTYNRGEFFKGGIFCTAIAARKIPLWSQVWRFKIASRQTPKGYWFGLDHEIPNDVSPYIREDEADAFQNMFIELEKDFEAKRFAIEEDDNDAESAEEVKARVAGSKFAKQ